MKTICTKREKKRLCENNHKEDTEKEKHFEEQITLMRLQRGWNFLLNFLTFPIKNSKRFFFLNFPKHVSWYCTHSFLSKHLGSRSFIVCGISLATEEFPVKLIFKIKNKIPRFQFLISRPRNTKNFFLCSLQTRFSITKEIFACLSSKNAKTVHLSWVKINFMGWKLS